MKEWETIQLYYACKLVAGYAFKSKDFGDYPDKVIKITHIVPPTVDMKNLTGVDLSQYERKKLIKYIAKQGDYVLAMTGATIGKMGRIEESEAYVNQRVLLFKNNPNVDKDYLFYVLQQNKFQQYILNHIDSESAQPNISAATVGKYEFLLPSLKIQNKIGKFLRLIDDKINVNNRINDNLEQQAAAIFRSWFVNCVPFGGIAPDEWKNVTLEDITAMVSRGITPKYADDTGQIIINQKCIRNHMIDLSLARNHRPKVINDKWLRFGDLLINSTGDGTLGRAAPIWFQPHNLTVDSHVTIVRPATENLIFYIGLWGTQHEKEIESLHTGSTGQTELPRDRVKAMELVLPDSKTLAHFNSVMAPMASAIVTNLEENQRLAALRDALLPKLMSGEIDVSSVKI